MKYLLFTLTLLVVGTQLQAAPIGRALTGARIKMVGCAENEFNLSLYQNICILSVEGTERMHVALYRPDLKYTQVLEVEVSDDMVFSRGGVRTSEFAVRSIGYMGKNKRFVRMPGTNTSPLQKFRVNIKTESGEDRILSLTGKFQNQFLIGNSFIWN